MTLTTKVHVGSPVDPMKVFRLMREAIGIPQSQPWRVDEREGVARIVSQPGGFDAALWVSHNRGKPLPGLSPVEGEEWEPDPVAYVSVSLDTAYAYRGPGGGCDALHRGLTTELGGWLDEQGIDWWAYDEFGGDWHHRQPCPLSAAEREELENGGTVAGG